MERAIADYLSEAPIFVRRLNGEITYWTEGARRLYGFDWSDAIGKLSHELLQTVFPAPLELINASLVSEGAWEGLLGHTRKDGVSLWTQSGWRMKDGDVVIETNTDVTQREMLSHELIHRVKNTVAIVQALARLSFSDQASYREFSRRLMALGRAHDELLRHHWEHGDLHHILQRTLESFGVLDRASRFTNSRPTRSSTAPFRSPPEESRCSGACSGTSASISSGRSAAGRPSPRRQKAASASACSKAF